MVNSASSNSFRLISKDVIAFDWREKDITEGIVEGSPSDPTSLSMFIDTFPCKECNLSVSVVALIFFWAAGMGVSDLTAFINP